MWTTSRKRRFDRFIRFRMLTDRRRTEIRRMAPSISRLLRDRDRDGNLEYFIIINNTCMD